MDYMANIEKGLTITGQSIEHYESALTEGLSSGWFLLGQLRSVLESDAAVLSQNPVDANCMIGLIFEVGSNIELDILIGDAALKGTENESENVFAGIENLADSAYRFVLFDRLVKSIKDNDAKGVLAAMIGFYSYAVYRGAENSSSAKNSRAGAAAHKESYQLKRDFLIWYRANQPSFKSNAAAAREGAKIVPIVERVLVRWITEYKKDIQLMGEEEYWNEF